MGFLDWVTGVLMGKEALDQANKTAQKHGDTTSGYFLGIHSWGDVVSIPSKAFSGLMSSLSDGFSSLGGDFSTPNKKPKNNATENYLQKTRDMIMQQKVNHAQDYVHQKDTSTSPNLSKYVIIIVLLLVILK